MSDEVDTSKMSKKEFYDYVMNKRITILPPIDHDEYPPIEGMEGPFTLRSGLVVYYDPKEGKYYNRKTDMFLSDEEHMAHDSPREKVQMKYIKESIQNIKDKLIRCADHLDRSGESEAANLIDQTLSDLSDIEKEASGVAAFGPTGRLASRYCPDHHGVQAERIGDHRVKCPLDGKEYDYLTGYNTYDGVHHPGSYPDKQTPDDASFYDAHTRFIKDPMTDEKSKF